MIKSAKPPAVAFDPEGSSRARTTKDERSLPIGTLCLTQSSTGGLPEPITTRESKTVLLVDISPKESVGRFCN